MKCLTPKTQPMYETRGLNLSFIQHHRGLIKFLLICFFAVSYSASEGQGHSGKYGYLQGRLLTKDNQPAPLISINVLPENKTTLTDEGGYFLFKKLNVGLHEVTISGVGIKTVTRQVEVKINDTSRVTLSLEIGIVELMELTVLSNTHPYLEKKSISVDRSNLSLEEIPQSIQILPLQILKDKQILSINEAVSSVAGMNFGGFEIVMRGFISNDGNYALNGIKYANHGFSLQASFINVERLEFIKGPSAVTFGDGNPGGLINVVTKKPKPEPRYETDFTYGSHNSFRLVEDITGPLSKNKKLLYRLIIGYTDNHSQDPNFGYQNIFLAPQLEYRFSEKSVLTYTLEYSHDEYKGDNLGRPAIYDSANKSWNPNAYPPGIYMGSSQGNGNSYVFVNNLEFTHQFSKNLQFRTVLLSTKSPSSSIGINLNGSPGIPQVTDDSIPQTNYLFKNSFYSLQSTTYFSFTIGKKAIRQNLLAGFDYYYSNNVIEYADIETRNINIIHPDYSWANFDFNNGYSSLSQNPGSQKYSYTTHGPGFFLQDIFSVGSKWKLLLGGRIETQHGNFGFNLPIDVKFITDSFNTRSTFLPKIGIVFQPDKKTTFYANYMSGFSPQALSDKGRGGPFPPELSYQFEGGIKELCSNGKLIITAAVYHIQKYNVIVPSTIPNRDSLVHDVTSKGFELSIQGTPTPSLNVLINYAYNITQAPADPNAVGKSDRQFPNAPKNNFNGWVKYNFIRGSLKGLGLGAGFNFISERTSNVAEWMLPAYTTIEAGISYQMKKMRFGINGYNLSNLTYYPAGDSPMGNKPGEPIGFRINLNYVLN